MTPPAITALLDQHRAVIESRELSFSEKLGWLLHASVNSNLYWPGKPGETLGERAAAIREALTEHQNERIRELIKRQNEREQAQRQEKRAVTTPRDLVREIAEQRTRVQAAASQFERARTPESYQIAIENLTLQSAKLSRLEKKKVAFFNGL